MSRNATLFVAVSVLSGFGSSAMALVSGIWILDLTGSPGLAGLAGFCVYAPTLAGPWLGALVDRLPRRPLAVGTNLGLAVLLGALLAVRDPGDAWLIYVVSFGYGLSYVLLDAAESALVPAAVPPGDLGAINGRRSSAQEGMKLVAPLAGAALYAWQGGHAVAGLSAGLPVIGAVLYGLLHVREPGRSPHRREKMALPASRELRITVLVAAVAIGVSALTTAPQYAVVTRDLGLPSAFVGVLTSGQGAGSIVAGLLAGRVIARRGVVFLGVTGALIYAAGLLLKCLPWTPVVVAGAVLNGALPWTLIAAVTAVQTQVPERLLGRASATANTLMFGPIVLANPAGSALVALGGRPGLAIGAALCVVTAGFSRTRSRQPDHA
ncbi:MFS transporter [Symbioplanes lichenis]|uniref:MFS transporter n=1 Tax=Symbioplanes lichenis TaxID=1629072 RepID=UPI002738AE6B|nr:MFS transporter [Actinoplanes lichenis]